MTDPLVRVRDGAVRGRPEPGNWAFPGAPGTAAAFGANRMQPPQPVRAWHGERDATAYRPTAPTGGDCAGEEHDMSNAGGKLAAGRAGQLAEVAGTRCG